VHVNDYVFVKHEVGPYRLRGKLLHTIDVFVSVAQKISAVVDVSVRISRYVDGTSCLRVRHAGRARCVGAQVEFGHELAVFEPHKTAMVVDRRRRGRRVDRAVESIGKHKVFHKRRGDRLSVIVVWPKVPKSNNITSFATMKGERCVSTHYLMCPSVHRLAYSHVGQIVAGSICARLHSVRTLF
jgi:hypothetical protein